MFDLSSIVVNLMDVDPMDVDLVDVDLIRMDVDLMDGDALAGGDSSQELFAEAVPQEQAGPPASELRQPDSPPPSPSGNLRWGDLFMLITVLVGTACAFIYFEERLWEKPSEKNEDKKS